MRARRSVNRMGLSVALIVAAAAFVLIWSHRYAATLTPHSSIAKSDLSATPSNASRGENSGNTFEAQSTAKIYNGRPILKASTTPTSVVSEIDNSVVGRPFEISSSVREGCKSDTIECPLVMESVAKMVKEPRDIEWAARMEETLQAAVDSGNAGKYSIRNVEGRTSTCILEIEVRVPDAFPRYDNVITSVLQPHALTIGAFESDSSGQRYHIELMDFFRR